MAKRKARVHSIFTLFFFFIRRTQQYSTLTFFLSLFFFWHCIGQYHLSETFDANLKRTQITFDSMRSTKNVNLL